MPSKEVLEGIARPKTGEEGVFRNVSSIAVKITGDKTEKMPLGLVWGREAGEAGKRATDGYSLQTENDG